MRATIIAAAAAVLILAGCSRYFEQPTAETAPLAAGVAAIRLGDQRALQAALASLEASADTQTPTCSKAVLVEARRNLIHGFLKPLDNASLFSMAPEARFVALQTIVQNGGRRPADTTAICREQLGPAAALEDGVARQRMVSTLLAGLSDWRDALRAQYGDSLDDRLTAANHVLAVNQRYVKLQP